MHTFLHLTKPQFKKQYLQIVKQKTGLDEADISPDWDTLYRNYKDGESVESMVYDMTYKYDLDIIDEIYH